MFPQVSQDDIDNGGVSSVTTVSVDTPIGSVTVTNSSGSQGLEQVNGIDIGELRPLYTSSVLLAVGDTSISPHPVHGYIF